MWRFRYYTWLDWLRLVWYAALCAAVIAVIWIAMVTIATLPAHIDRGITAMNNEAATAQAIAALTPVPTPIYRVRPVGKDLECVYYEHDHSRFFCLRKDADGTP